MTSPVFHCHVSVQTQDFDVSHELQALRGADKRIGAVCSFVGLVRDMSAPHEDAPALQSMELEHYPGMTEKALHQIVEAARQRFDVLGVRLIHRVGLLAPQAHIVLVAVASSHRGQAFAACEFLMDYLKTQAPFWKKETTTAGDAHWVDAKQTDEAALARWGAQSNPTSHAP
jgi:molybdopterin synthase catalytic subunit